MNYTSIEQSKHLLELGLKPETADMYYVQLSEGLDEYTALLKRPQCNYEDDIQCWSIGALLKLIPNYGLRKMGGRLLISFYSAPRITPTPNHVIDDCVNELDAVYQMVCWLLQNNYYIKTE